MSFIQGEARNQGTLFPTTLDELIPLDHMCRVIDIFVSKLDMGALGFVRAEPAEIGRPGYDPRDLLKLYLYGYLQQVRSSRRLEAECQRNVEVMWLLGRLVPDHKSIAEFRRMHHEAVTAAGAELVRFARSVGLIRGQWIAIDGSKFRAVSSARSVFAREEIRRYLEQIEQADGDDQILIESNNVAVALEKLNGHPEPEARFMLTTAGRLPAYNVQTAVDVEHSLIVVQQVTTETNDERSLLPMAEAAQKALGDPPSLNIVADAGYCNGEQAEACESKGIVPHVPVIRSVNNRGDGTLFDRTQFHYDDKTDTLRCPAGETLKRNKVHRTRKAIRYSTSPGVCCKCPLRSKCTTASKRIVTRHLHEDALQRMQQRTTRELMRLRRITVEHPFATLKHRIFGHPRFLLRGIKGTQSEIGLATMAYNLKRMLNVLGSEALHTALAI